MIDAVPLQTLPAELIASERRDQADDGTLHVTQSQAAHDEIREEMDIEANVASLRNPMTSQVQRYLHGKTPAILLSLVGIIVTGVTIWPSYASMRDGHRQLQLALWTAHQEYAKYCAELVSIL